MTQNPHQSPCPYGVVISGAGTATPVSMTSDHDRQANWRLYSSGRLIGHLANRVTTRVRVWLTSGSARAGCVGV
jgi:hypothetical protein